MNSAEAKTIRPTNLLSGFLVTRNRTGDKGSFRETAGSWQEGALRQAQGKRAAPRLRAGQAGSKKGVFWLFIPERLAQTAYWTPP